MKKLFTAIFSVLLLIGAQSAIGQESVLDKNPPPVLKAGNMISFPISSGPDGKAFYLAADRPSNKVLIVFHQSYGLTNGIKKDAQDWHKLLDGNVEVYAVDLYDGKTSASRFEADKMMNGIDAARAEAIINGLLQKIGPGKQIATLGWGMGGKWAFKASAMIGKNAAGCAMLYGYIPADDVIAQFKTDIIYAHANEHPTLTRNDVEQFRKKVEATGHGFQYEYFGGSDGFANEGDPNMMMVSVRETRMYILRFLTHKLSLDQL